MDWGNTAVKRSAVVLLVLGIAVLLFAFTVPPYMTGTLRTLPTDLDFTLSSTSDQGITRTEHIRSFPTPKIDEIRIDATQTFDTDEGEQLASISESVTLIGHSRFPVFEPSASISGTPVDSHDQVREGLRYFFPANTLRQSYPYFDEFLGEAGYVDYAGRDKDTYIFHQSLHDQELADGRSYSVDRTLWVDRHSGLILNKQEAMTVDNTPTVEFTFTPETRALMEDKATEITQGLLAAKAMAFTAKFIGLVLLGFGLWRSGIFHRAT